MQLFTFGHPCEHQLRRTCIGGVGCPLNGYPDMWCCSYIKGKINFKRERPCEGQRCRWNFTHPTQTHFDAVTVVIHEGRQLAAKVEDSGPAHPHPAVAAGGIIVPGMVVPPPPSNNSTHPAWDMVSVIGTEYAHVGDVVYCGLQMLRNPSAACGRKLGQLFAFGAIKSGDAKAFGQYLKAANRKTNDLMLMGAYDYLCHVAPGRAGRKKQGDATDDLRSDLVEHIQNALTHNGALTDKDDQRTLQFIFIQLLKGFTKNKRKAELLELAIGKFPAAAQKSEAAEAAIAAALANTNGGGGGSTTSTTPPAVTPTLTHTIITSGATSSLAKALAGGKISPATGTVDGSKHAGNQLPPGATLGPPATGTIAASAHFNSAAGTANINTTAEFSEVPKQLSISKRANSTSGPFEDTFSKYRPILLTPISANNNPMNSSSGTPANPADLALLGGLFSLLGTLDGAICGIASTKPPPAQQPTKEQPSPIPPSSTASTPINNTSLAATPIPPTSSLLSSAPQSSGLPNQVTNSSTLHSNAASLSLLPPISRNISTKSFGGGVGDTGGAVGSGVSASASISSPFAQNGFGAAAGAAVFSASFSNNNSMAGPPQHQLQQPAPVHAALGPSPISESPDRRAWGPIGRGGGSRT